MNLWKSLFLAAIVLPSAAFGQAEKVKVDIKGFKLDQQETPQIQATNVVDKRWKPKAWLEMELAMDLKLANDLGGRDGSLPEMQVKYFVGLNQRTAEGKNIVLTGSISYKDVPANETVVAMGFISPSTLKRVLQKDNGGKGDVAAYGCEVLVGGERVAFESSAGGAWWFDPNTQGLPDKFAAEDGGVLPKSKTPFAPFWGDYDLPVSTNN